MRGKFDLLQYLDGFNAVSCHKYSSPVGDISLFGDNGSLKAVVFGSRLFNKKRFGPFPGSGKGSQLDFAVKYLDYYFQGRGHQVSIKPVLYRGGTDIKKGAGKELLLDISRFTENEQKVYESLLKVAPGKTVSYGELAKKAGLSGAARFTGTTMAKNLFPILIPCHRVVKSDGRRGFYSGGVKIKDFLLDHESR